MKKLLFIIKIFLLTFTWFILFLYLAHFTELYLAPWGVAIEAIPPTLGTWQRTLNDFFESWPGEILPSLSVIVISILIFFYRSRYTSQNRETLPFVFSLTNFTLIVGGAFIQSLVRRLPDLWLSQPRPEIDIGYHRTWPGIMLMSFFIVFFFLGQLTLSYVGSRKKGPGQRIKKPNVGTEPAKLKKLMKTDSLQLKLSSSFSAIKNPNFDPQKNKA